MRRCWRVPMKFRLVFYPFCNKEIYMGRFVDGVMF